MTSTTKGAHEGALRTVHALEILRSVAPRPVRVTDLARLLAVDVSNASRLMNTLCSVGYASRTDDRRFTLGPRSLVLAPWGSRRAEVWMSELRAVAAVIGRTIFLAQLVGDRGVVCGQIRGDDAIADPAEAGTELPLWATAAGKALLAQLPSVRQVRLLPSEPYPEFAPATLQSWGRLAGSVERGRRTLVFEAHGEYDIDLIELAIGLPRSGGEPLAAFVTLSRRAEQAQRQVRRALRTIAQTLHR